MFIVQRGMTEVVDAEDMDRVESPAMPHFRAMGTRTIVTSDEDSDDNDDDDVYDDGAEEASDEEYSDSTDTSDDEIYGQRRKSRATKPAHKKTVVRTQKGTAVCMKTGSY